MLEQATFLSLKLEFENMVMSMLIGNPAKDVWGAGGRKIGLAREVYLANGAAATAAAVVSGNLKIGNWRDKPLLPRYIFLHLGPSTTSNQHLPILTQVRIDVLENLSIFLKNRPFFRLKSTA